MALRLAIPTRKTCLSRALLRWSRSCTNRGSSGTAPERRQRHLQRPAKPLRDSSKAQVWSSRPCFAQPVETEAHYGTKTATPSKIDGRGLGISAGRTNNYRVLCQPCRRIQAGRANDRTYKWWKPPPLKQTEAPGQDALCGRKERPGQFRQSGHQVAGVNGFRQM
jgi:hypothetical protein